MGEINFSTGLTEYSLNGCCQVAFNPTDSAFAGKLAKLFGELDEKQEAFRRELEQAEGDALFDISRRMDSQMRALLDGLFDKPICGELFGDMNVYALAGGLPVWANLLLALIDEMGESFEEQRQLADPALARHLAKYRL